MSVRKAIAPRLSFAVVAARSMEDPDLDSVYRSFITCRVSGQGSTGSFRVHQRWSRLRTEGTHMAEMTRVVHDTAFERHFSPKALAELWNFSEDTIQRWFEDEPGVLKHGETGAKHGKRRKLYLRIPESIALKVYQERTR